MIIGLLEDGRRSLEFEDETIVISEQDYEWLLRGDCSDTLSEKQWKEFKANVKAKGCQPEWILSGGVFYRHLEPMFHVSRWELDNSNFNISPTEKDAVAKYFEKCLNKVSLEELHKEHLEG
ncbi:MAG: hypothetical protein ACTSVR_05435 [Candidatus Thorarchaeota archaeon]